MKVSELIGAQLDYWAARAEARPLELIKCAPHGEDFIVVSDNDEGEDRFEMWSPSRLWQHCGPIIERELIHLEHGDLDGMVGTGRDWYAACHGKTGMAPTPLVAAMRAYVAWKFGDEVPDIK
jgi:hypothetical protein